eukprot:2063240-Pyramimonas_sp.AAC.1
MGSLAGSMGFRMVIMFGLAKISMAMPMWGGHGTSCCARTAFRSGRKTGGANAWSGILPDPLLHV